MKVLYDISIYLYLFALRTASLFHPKARLWVKGRRHVFAGLQADAASSSAPSVWFHCASLGEFEQGRPLIERYRLRYPEHRILLTFFSPSGYEIRKSYAGADRVLYLPLDTPGNAERFIDIVKPAAVFFVKYEFWFNYLNELNRRKIPTYLVSGIFREDHYFFKSYGRWFRNQLHCFTHFYLQDAASEKLLNGIGYKNTSVTGDTRFDRVSEIAANVREIVLAKQFVRGKKVLIAGSSWSGDEKLMQHFRLKGSRPAATGNKHGAIMPLCEKVIIAPHETDAKHISAIEAGFEGKAATLRYSVATAATVDAADVLIIDNIGMLSSLYQYGTVAFIGGGFGKGIHNILEAAAFGLPVIFGPNYEKFTEAKELIRLGGAFAVGSSAELEQTLQLLSDPDVLRTAAQVARMYIESRVGASGRILDSVSLSLLHQ